MSAFDMTHEFSLKGRVQLASGIFNRLSGSTKMNTR